MTDDGFVGDNYTHFCEAEAEATTYQVQDLGNNSNKRNGLYDVDKVKKEYLNIRRKKKIQT